MINGSRAKIKSWPTIERTLTDFNWRDDYYHKNDTYMRFDIEMKQFCHKEGRIVAAKVSPRGGYMIYRCDVAPEWWWHEDWVYDMTHTRHAFDDNLFEI